MPFGEKSMGKSKHLCQIGLLIGLPIPISIENCIKCHWFNPHLSCHAQYTTAWTHYLSVPQCSFCIHGNKKYWQNLIFKWGETVCMVLSCLQHANTIDNVNIWNIEMYCMVQDTFIYWEIMCSYHIVVQFCRKKYSIRKVLCRNWQHCCAFSHGKKYRWPWCIPWKWLLQQKNCIFRSFVIINRKPKIQEFLKYNESSHMVEYNLHLSHIRPWHLFIREKKIWPSNNQHERNSTRYNHSSPNVNQQEFITPPTNTHKHARLYYYIDCLFTFFRTIALCHLPLTSKAVAQVLVWKACAFTKPRINIEMEWVADVVSTVGGNGARRVLL